MKKFVRFLGLKIIFDRFPAAKSLIEEFFGQ